jgi:hypothetical protein
LPEAKGHKSHEREPETLIDGIESYSVDEYFFEESTHSIEPVDGFIFEQRCNESEGSVNDNEGEVVASADKESRLPDGLLELGGRGLSLVGFRNEGCEEIGQELEVEFAQFKEEVGVVVWQVLNQEVVEVNCLEHFSYQK